MLRNKTYYSPWRMLLPSNYFIYNLLVSYKDLTTCVPTTTFTFLFKKSFVYYCTKLSFLVLSQYSDYLACLWSPYVIGQTIYIFFVYFIILYMHFYVLFCSSIGLLCTLLQQLSVLVPCCPAYISRESRRRRENNVQWSRACVCVCVCVSVCVCPRPHVHTARTRM